MVTNCKAICIYTTLSNVTVYNSKLNCERNAEKTSYQLYTYNLNYTENLVCFSS